MRSVLHTTVRVLVLSMALLLFMPALAQAQETDQPHAGQVMGVHILNIHEFDQVTDFANDVLERQAERFVTVPLTLEDLDNKDAWQQFFDRLQDERMTPIVRLATRYDPTINAWVKPTRQDVVELISFLDELSWPTENRYIIIFNEVNHAKEWGGEIDPAGYVDTFIFASNWAHASHQDFVVLPAAMDLAASNGFDASGHRTQEAFSYLREMHTINGDVFSYADVWNSHSYPNPGFSAAPYKSTKNSLRGYQHELAFLENLTGKTYQVMITETGWEANLLTLPWLETYYTYTLQYIWNDERIIAVTPFVLQGDPGPFAGFGFLDRHQQPTAQYHALDAALDSLLGE